jgi:hypothetical protein
MTHVLQRSLLIVVLTLLVLAGSGVALAACSVARAGGDPGLPPPDAPVVRFPAVGAYAVVELAVTDEQRQRGLMERTELADGTGMLFVFPATSRSAFWMKNTLVPLSIAFIDEQRTIVDIQDMQPLDETLTVPAAAYRYALEVPQGWFSRVGVARGQPVELPSLPE